METYGFPPWFKLSCEGSQLHFAIQVPECTADRRVGRSRRYDGYGAGLCEGYEWRVSGARAGELAPHLARANTVILTRIHNHNRYFLHLAHKSSCDYSNYYVQIIIIKIYSYIIQSSPSTCVLNCRMLGVRAPCTSRRTHVWMSASTSSPPTASRRWTSTSWMSCPSTCLSCPSWPRHVIQFKSRG